MAIQDPNAQPMQDPNAQAMQAQPQGGGEQMPQPNPEIMSPIVAEHMDELDAMRAGMNPKTGDAYDRVLTAGMKMMYSPENASTIQALIADENIPMANKLGEGVANLLIMMDNQGNGTIPKEVIIPVGVSLVLEAADYLFEIGVEVTEEDLGNAIELMMRAVFLGYGYPPEEVEKYVNDLGEKYGFEEEVGTNVAETEGAPAAPADADETAFNEGFAAEQAQRQQGM